MLLLILVISLFSVSSDTIEIKGTENIAYRLLASDSILYFSHKANKNWSVPKIIDEKVSEYTMTVTSGEYIHLAFIKQGTVFYKMNMYPVNKDSLRKDGTPRWEHNITISIPELTEPASDICMNVNDEYLDVTWQASLENNPLQVEKWQRKRWLMNPPLEWEAPQNVSLNTLPIHDKSYCTNNRDPIQMKRIVFLQSGLYTGSAGIPICCDSDHNGMNEIIFRTGTIYPTNPLRWEVWEYHLMNRYELVFADTGAYPYPPGITTGNFRLYDVGDIDGDSLIDLSGMNIYKVPDTTYNIVPTQESPNYSSYPSSLSWYYRFSYPNFAWSSPVYFTSDLDNDGRKEIICRYYGDTYIFENISNNQNQLVWCNSIPSWSIAFDDFDGDNYQEFVTAHSGSTGLVSVYENTSPDQYELIYRDSVFLPNGGGDVFCGNDLDQDGNPEFFVPFAVVGATFHLYMWEATGNNTYQRTLIDQISYSVSQTTGRRSKCGDIDGDGIEELVWATPTRLYVYKASGNNQFQRIWQWNQDHGTNECLIVNIYDMNKNGYNEIVVGGSGKTSIFEVEAVRLLRPNGGETFHSDSQGLIRWQTYNPPRCDSISLFYSIDNGSNYTMITHGLSGNDTSYLWTVPNANSDSCKVKIIAYGPGWQYDESDGVFRISATGIEEIATLPLAMTLGLQVLPNPAKSFSNIHYSLPVESKVSLNLYDISGRLIKTLVNENKQPGNYSLTLNTKTLSSGVYFLSLQTEDKRIIERLVVVK